MECKGRIPAGYEVAVIPDEKYWNIYRRAWTEWEENIARAKMDNLSVADVIADNYKTSYAVGADIANSIALSKAIG